MFSRTISKILGRSYCGRTLSCRFSSSTAHQSSTGEEPDPAPLFFNREVQGALELLTRIDYKKAVRNRLTGKKLKPPEYKFMTSEELEEALDLAKKKARKRLQMPPVVKVRKEITEILCKDEALEGLNECKFVFTDISFGIRDRDRLIVYREPNGTLRHAKWEERDRINYIYFPREGKEITAPKLFQEEYLKDLLERESYEYILDRACIQYEPDDLEYKRLTELVYQRVNERKHFEPLRSTRHFGPLVFHLAWNKDIDNLLCDIIESGKMEEAVVLINLFHKLHPEAKSAEKKYDDVKEGDDGTELILHYASLDSFKAPLIEKMVAAYRELKEERRRVDEGIKKAHGIDSSEP